MPRNRRMPAGSTQDSGRKLVHNSTAGIRALARPVFDFDSAITLTLIRLPDRSPPYTYKGNGWRHHGVALEPGK